jgi:DNA-binding HxlR family transcriptional regulator
MATQPARGTMDPMARTDPDSPLAAAVARVGDRWSLLLVEALLTGPRRFNEILDAVEGIAPNILSQRLKHLEQEAIVISRAYSKRPPRFTYELSARGRELAGALRLLAHWAAGRVEGADPPRHRACGTPLEARWFCPTCARAIADEEESDLVFL